MFVLRELANMLGNAQACISVELERMGWRSGPTNGPTQAVGKKLNNRNRLIQCYCDNSSSTQVLS
jgi:hypothetical protein